MFIEVLFMIKSETTYMFINKRWAIQAQESYFTIKGNDILSYTTTWVNLEHNKSKKLDTKGHIISGVHFYEMS